MFVKVFVATLFFIGFCRSQNITLINVSGANCPEIRNPDVTLGGPECCSNTYRTFRRKYNSLENYRLTSLLEKLRAWNCPQFEEECENRYFQFNRFTALVYDRFCNETAFTENCRDELSDIETIYNATGPSKQSYLCCGLLFTVQ